MGLEISVPRRLHPKTPHNHTNVRTYGYDGEELFVLKVIKGKYRKPPRSFSLEWTTIRDEADLLKIAFDFYDSVHRRFIVPDIVFGVGLASQIRERALALGEEYFRKDLLRADQLEELKAHPEKIEPLSLIIYSSEGLLFKPEDFLRGRKIYFGQVGVPKNQSWWEQLLEHPYFPVDFFVACFNSPFAQIYLKGNSCQGMEQKIRVSSPYKIPGEVLEFFRATSIVHLDVHQISAINERLRKPISELPRPKRAIGAKLHNI